MRLPSETALLLALFLGRCCTSASFVGGLPTASTDEDTTLLSHPHRYIALV